MKINSSYNTKVTFSGLDENQITSQETFREQIRYAENPFGLTFFLRSKKGKVIEYRSLEYALATQDEESFFYLLKHEKSLPYFSQHILFFYLHLIKEDKLLNPEILKHLLDKVSEASVRHHFFDSLVFLYLGLIKEDKPLNLEILKLLLDKVSDININMNPYHSEFKRTFNFLDFAIFHMSGFKKLHTEVIEELFQRGIRNAGSFNSFEALKTCRSKCFFEIQKCTTRSVKKTEIRNQQQLLTHHIFKKQEHPDLYTFDKQGKFLLSPGKLSTFFSLKTNCLGGVWENPSLKRLYQYHNIIKKYVQNSNSLSVHQFKELIFDVRYLIKIILKIYEKSKKYPLKPIKPESFQISYEHLWKQRHIQPLFSIWLIDGKKIKLSNPMLFQFLEFDFYNPSTRKISFKKEMPVLICNYNVGYSIMLERSVWFLHKYLIKYMKYFQELAKNKDCNRFKDCFDQKEIQNISLFLSLSKNYPFSQSEAYIHNQKLLEEVFTLKNPF